MDNLADTPYCVDTCVHRSLTLPWPSFHFPGLVSATLHTSKQNHLQSRDNLDKVKQITCRVLSTEGDGSGAEGDGGAGGGGAEVKTVPQTLNSGPSL